MLPSWIPHCITLALGLPILQAAMVPKVSLILQHEVTAGWRS